MGEFPIMVLLLLLVVIVIYFGITSRFFKKIGGFYDKLVESVTKQDEKEDEDEKK